MDAPTKGPRPVDSTPGWILLKDRADIDAKMDIGITIWRPAINEAGNYLLNEQGLFQCMVPITDKNHDYTSSPFYFIQDKKTGPGATFVSSVKSMFKSKADSLPGADSSDEKNLTELSSNQDDTPIYIHDDSSSNNALSNGIPSDGISLSKIEGTIPLPDESSSASDVSVPSANKGEYNSDNALKDIAKMGSKVINLDGINKVLNDAASKQLPQSDVYNKISNILGVKVEETGPNPRDLNMPKGRLAKYFNSLIEKASKSITGKIGKPKSLDESVITVSQERKDKNAVIKNIIDYAKTEGILKNVVNSDDSSRTANMSKLLNKNGTSLRPAMKQDNSGPIVPQQMIKRDSGDFTGDPVLKVFENLEPIYVGTLINFVDDTNGKGRTWSFLKDGVKRIERTNNNENYNPKDPLFFAVPNTDGVLDESISVKGGKTRRFKKHGIKSTRKHGERRTTRSAKRRAGRRTRRG